jgi:Na+/proline symporter
VIVASISLLLAILNKDLIYMLVSYAWSGLGASFGPPLILALWWRRTSRAGVIAGMAGGLITAVVWKHLPEMTLTLVLDIKFVSFAVSLALTSAVSLLVAGPTGEADH